jgi:serine/threonine protein kinase
MSLDADPTCLSCGTTNPLGSKTCRVCGAPLEASVFLSSGSRVGSYELVAVLGRGGFGVTYKAKDVATGEIVALKELFPDGLAMRDSDGTVRIAAASLEEFTKLKGRFTLEAELLQSITNRASSHFIALFAEHATLYLAMEFVPGETLEARLTRGAKFTMAEARSAIRDVLGVLQDAHTAGLLHRDIKPANIILTPNGAELIDFGSGLRFQPNRTMQISQRVLTPEYAPLEFYGQNVRLSPASDLYSVAATFYEAISGVRPPSALDRANGVPLEKLGILRPDISQNFANTIDAALALRVDARPQSARAMLTALNKPVRSSARSTAATASTQPPIPSSLSAVPAARGYPAHWTLIALGGWWLILMLLALVADSLESVDLVFNSGLLAFASLAGGALVIAPLRWILARFFRTARPIGIYRQAMLGLYSFGGVFLLRALLPAQHGFWGHPVLPVVIGYVVALIGLLGSTSASTNRPLWQPVFAGLGIFIPFLLYAPVFFVPLFNSFVPIISR